MQSDNYRVPSDNAFSNPIQLNALPPLHPQFDADGLNNTATLYYNNLIELEGNNVNLAKTLRSISNAYAEWNISPFLNFRSQAGIDLNNLQEQQFLGKRTLDGAPNGYAYNNQVTASVFTWSNTLNFHKSFGQYSDLEALLGTEYQEGNSSGASVEGRAFPNDRFTKIASAPKVNLPSFLILPGQTTSFITATSLAQASAVTDPPALVRTTVMVTSLQHPLDGSLPKRTSSKVSNRLAS
jgi:hypothetical protein